MANTDMTGGNSSKEVPLPSKISITWKPDRVNPDNKRTCLSRPIGLVVQSRLKNSDKLFAITLVTGIRRVGRNTRLGIHAVIKNLKVKILNVKFSILDKDGLEEKTQETTALELVKWLTQDNTRMPKRVASFFLTKDDQDISLDDFVLQLKQGMTIKCEIKYIDTLPSPKPFDDFVPNRLSEGLSSLFENGELTDCTVVCGAARVPCHRAVLCARSPVFKAGTNKVPTQRRIKFKRKNI